MGISLSEYLLGEVTDLARLPTLEEHVARVRARPMVRFDVPAAELIREAREERDELLRPCQDENNEQRDAGDREQAPAP